MERPSDQHSNRGTESIDQLRNEFREHLDLFYRRLKLAPPYDSVEKAVGVLTARLKSMTSDDLQGISTDHSRRWAEFRAAFIASGLSQKHRGIIAGLARSRHNLDLPPEFDHFLNVYLSPPAA
jgi:hypothetical protein